MISRNLTITISFTLLSVFVFKCTVKESEKVIDKNVNYQKCIAPLFLVQNKVNGNYAECNVYCYNLKNQDSSNEVRTKDNTYKYNNNGYLIEEIYYIPDRNLWYKNLYKYDNRGNIIRSLCYSPKSKYTNKIIYTYNEQGNVIEEVRDDSTPEIYTYEYIINNNEIEQYRINPDGSTHKWLYIFNHDNRIIKLISYNWDETISDKWIYKYDDFRNLIEMVCYLQDGTIDSKYSFKYDDRGNIIEELRYNDSDEPKYRLEYIYSK